jgi:ubiquinone/menaquinone biosynthesis C-methylase UbiE
MLERKTISKFAAVAALVVAGYGAYRWRKATKAEIERLAALLDWSPGRVVADIGAGGGVMTIAAAKRVLPGGHVFATDVDSKSVRGLQKKVAKQGLSNVTVLRSEQNDCCLPVVCCDAILLRGSYHHFTDPAALNASLFRALRPGGVLAVIEFSPRWWLTLFAPVKGAPANRGGHGIRPELLVEELKTAGLELEQVIPRWFLDVYCAVFRKP